MAGQIGDTVADMFTSLIKDANTQTPPIDRSQLERLRLELNRLQGVTNQQIMTLQRARRAAHFKC